MKFCHSLLLSICMTIVLTCTTQAQFSQPGELDTTFNFGKPHSFFTDPANPQPGEGASNPVYSTLLQPDGKVLIAGSFTSYNGANRNRVVRLNVHGNMDTTFKTGIGANNTVWALAVQPDGKMLIGGTFDNYNGTARRRIARLNSNGSLDNTFNPDSGANDQVSCFAVQLDGKVLIGGRFTNYNGTARIRIARLNSDGSIDSTFNPGTGANDVVRTLSLQPDGKIFIGGDFTNYNGTASNRIARLNSNGSLDTSFSPISGANGQIHSIVLKPNGRVLIGGSFSSYNGTPRNRVASLNVDGSLDSTFHPGAGASSSVFSLSLQPDGKIIIGGWFTSYNGIPRNYIARINADGSLDANFDPGTGANSWVSSFALQSDGKILIGGLFTIFNNVTTNRIARLHVNGNLDSTFNQGIGANEIVYSIFHQPNGKLLIGGNFTSYNGKSQNRIARLNSDGSLDATFNTGLGANNLVRSITLQPNGKVIICGNFSSYNGTPRNLIARLNTDGSLDTTFNPGFGANDQINSVIIQLDGKLLIGGWFTNYNLTVRNRIARLNADGSLDSTFNPGTGANNVVYSLIQQPDGKVLIAGSFNSYNGISRNRVARLNIDGSLDLTFNPGLGANGTVQAVALQSDGRVFIVGAFNTYNGIYRNCITRINGDGSLDSTFNPGVGVAGSGFGTSLYSLAIQFDGKILIGGVFTSYNGISSNYIAQLNTNGSLDTNFNLGTGSNGMVLAIVQQLDGKLLIGGSLTNYNGIYRSNIARVLSTSTITSINELTYEEDQKTSAYPVPFQNELRIKTQGPFNYQIIDLRGIVHLSGISEAHEATCLTENLASGIYLVKITLKGQTYVRKVVKE